MSKQRENDSPLDLYCNWRWCNSWVFCSRVSRRRFWYSLSFWTRCSQSLFFKKQYPSFIKYSHSIQTSVKHQVLDKQRKRHSLNPSCGAPKRSSGLLLTIFVQQVSACIGEMSFSSPWCQRPSTESVSIFFAMEPMIVSLLKFMLNGSVRGLGSVQLSYLDLRLWSLQSCEKWIFAYFIRAASWTKTVLFQNVSGTKKVNFLLIISTWPEGPSNYLNQVG